MIDYPPDPWHGFTPITGATCGVSCPMNPFGRLLLARREGRLGTAIKVRIRRVAGPVAQKWRANVLPSQGAQANSHGDESSKVLRQLTLLAEQQDSH